MSKPKLSLNQFAKYAITSSSKERHEIIRLAKFPDLRKGRDSWYAIPKVAIPKYIVSGGDVTILDDAIEEVKLIDPESKSNKRSQDWHRSNKKNSLELLHNIKDADLSRLKKYEKLGYSQKISPVEIDGVLINVFPEIILKRPYQGQTSHGAIKLHYSVGNEFDQDMQKIVAYILYEFVEQLLGDATNKHCYYYGIHNETIQVASKNNDYRKGIISETCKDIRWLWEKIEKYA